MPPVAEPKNVADLVRRVREGATIDYVFFWRPYDAAEGVVGAACCSQWYPAAFVLEDRTFATAEHYMMWKKAMIFRDKEIAERVLAAAHPRDARSLGRKVKRYQDDVWHAQRTEVVVAANIAKFSQNPALGDYLIESAGRILVEASPEDRIWGIGLHESDADARHPELWRGENLLGFALMDVRRMLIAARAKHR